MRFLNWFRRKKNVESGAPLEAVREPGPAAEAVAPTQDVHYAPDRPWSPGDEDPLRRREFARRIATTIAAQANTGATVVGVYGPWGEGKTSLLRMVESDLRSLDVETVWFNPWYFRGANTLVPSFLAQLAETLSVRLGTASDEFKRVLTKYGGILESFPFSLYGIDPGKLMTSIGERIKASDIDGLKLQIERILEDRNLGVVVFMDDIDRLDRAEIHSVLKLVKLVAGFRRVTYVLAFDDEAVAAAIGTEYADGGQAAGRSFLEKIVQVPLRIPRTDSSTALQLTLGKVDRALKSAQVEITEADATVFRRYFDPIFAARPQTVRGGKRFGNSLLFALPLLKGEVNVADLLLLEGLRAFAPAIHDALPAHRELLIGRPAVMSMHGGYGQAQRDQDKVRWDSLLALVEPELRNPIAQALQHLFPNVGRFTKNMSYMGDWFTRWSQEQRLCSDLYFDRYFQYAVPPNDVSDMELGRMFDTLSLRDLSSAASIYDVLCTDATATRFVEKVRLREKQLSPIQAAGLIQLLGIRGASLPRIRSLFTFDTPHVQAAVLVLRAMRRVDANERLSLARALVESPADLGFACECLRMLRHSEDSKYPRVLSADEEQTLFNIIKRRLSDEVVRQPFYLRESIDAATLMRWWRHTADEGETDRVLRERLKAQPAEALRLIAAMASQPWSAETGIPLGPQIEREEYDAIARLVEPKAVVEALKETFGDVVNPTADDRQLDHPDDIDEGRSLNGEQRFARQFVWLHQKARSPSDAEPTSEAAAIEPSETEPSSSTDGA